jgi:hypothetical protein
MQYNNTCKINELDKVNEFNSFCDLEKVHNFNKIYEADSKPDIFKDNQGDTYIVYSNDYLNLAPLRAGFSDLLNQYTHMFV